ncbi:hypothetical protein [Herbaspirillum sp. CAH-3]|uniref:hypothetical protein n=1 Tax=Herbaspirillum sp. CAH-3 TaxID=2605746 RepID=UPI0012ACDB83|nr:hypothetical protein [Herbaspirillum sp. CAH-3]MRT31902.1 hypothetical protein [Herbaspirillum sp. CAH-3]
MGEASKADLDRIRHELDAVSYDAAWKVTSLILQASAVRNGLDQPLAPEERDSLDFLINRLNSAARDAEEIVNILYKLSREQ